MHRVQEITIQIIIEQSLVLESLLLERAKEMDFRTLH